MSKKRILIVGGVAGSQIFASFLSTCAQIENQPQVSYICSIFCIVSLSMWSCFSRAKIMLTSTCFSRLGGAAAATRLRRLDGDAEIIIFEMGGFPSFANCGMPYYIGNTITDRSKLLVTTTESLKNIFNIEVRVYNRVDKIHRYDPEMVAVARSREKIFLFLKSVLLYFFSDSKTIDVTEIQTGRQYNESYDFLVLATGAAPRVLPIPGRDLPNVFTLRDLADMDHIYQSLSTAPAGDTIAIIGGGYIGLELADVLIKRGFKVQVVEFLKQVLSVFDAEMTTPIERELKSLGVQVHLGDSAEKISQSPTREDALILSTKNGLNIEAHSVIMSIGVKPASELAAAAGLKIGAMGGIIVDVHMRTEDPSIYAVGDVVEVTDFVTGQHIQVPLAGPAARQARVAADNICGRQSTFRGTQGTAILSVGKLVAGMTGATEKGLQRANIKYNKIYIHPNQHVAYYPGAKTLTSKLLFSPGDGKILGLQIVGEEGVDKITDSIAMAIQGQMTVFDLEESELSYAPQFGAAKSVVNMLGFVASGVIRGDQRHVYLEDLPKMENVFILDVRNPPELTQQGTIPNGVNIPLPTLRQNLDKVPKDKTIVTVCRVGQRAYSTLNYRNFGAIIR